MCVCVQEQWNRKTDKNYDCRWLVGVVIAIVDKKNKQIQLYDRHYVFRKFLIVEPSGNSLTDKVTNIWRQSSQPTMAQ
jgi:hypothetical protein